MFISTLTSGLSWGIGKLASIPLPPHLSRLVIGTYSWWYNVDLSEVKQPVSSFRSLREFFTRELREGARPLEGELVSPVDGVLKQSFRIGSDQKLVVKGLNYDVNRLLGDDNASSRFEGGFLYHFYLSPRDYHRVHSPLSGRLVRGRYIPGNLLPVNPLFCSLVPDLFVTNERLVTFLDLAEGGEAAVVMVGALNVGAIEAPFDPSLVPASYWSGQRKREVAYDAPKDICAGDHIGTFALGSSVVVLLSAHAVERFGPLSAVEDVTPVQYGRSLTSKA